MAKRARERKHNRKEMKQINSNFGLFGLNSRLSQEPIVLSIVRLFFCYSE